MTTYCFDALLMGVSNAVDRELTGSSTVEVHGALKNIQSHVLSDSIQDFISWLESASLVALNARRYDASETYNRYLKLTDDTTN